MWSLSLPIYQVKLWVPFYCLGLTSIAQLVEHLPLKQCVVGLNPAWTVLFSLGKEMFRLVVLPCFD